MFCNRVVWITDSVYLSSWARIGQLGVQIPSFEANFFGFVVLKIVLIF